MNMKVKTYLFIFICSIMTLVACGNKAKTKIEDEQDSTQVNVPIFNSDSAFQYIKAQTDFGPRIPNSKAHDKCGDYLIKKLTSFGAKVVEQKMDLIGYDGKILKGRNIIGSYKPENPKRIMICSHWDSRPWADNDPDKKNHHTPIDGANDGASGVGVILEMARLMQKQQPELGIDFIFFDMEDYGTPQWEKKTDNENSWCLGAQYWARTPHVDRYNARFAILLDMVGGKNTTFYQESYSLKYAKGIVDKVWNKANSLGYGNYFIESEGAPITDDHLPINKMAQIPCIDIVPCILNGDNSSFGPTWHTLNDNIDHIDKNTLQVVGNTLLEVIYNEK